jgi:hypothetical protein
MQWRCPFLFTVIAAPEPQSPPYMQKATDDYMVEIADQVRNDGLN